MQTGDGYLDLFEDGSIVIACSTPEGVRACTDGSIKSGQKAVKKRAFRAEKAVTTFSEISGKKRSESGQVTTFEKIK